MVKKFKTFDPQLVFAEQTAGSAIVLTNEAKLSLYKKSQKSGYSTDILEEVYRRGYRIWNESFGQTAEQFAFDRVNSFISGGFAADLDDDLFEDKKGYKNPTGGLTQKGRDHYNRETGGHLQAPVTTPPSKLKAGSKAAGRRKSFCARMGGVEGPMKKPNGEPTRKALALRKWNCEETELEEKRGLWDNIHAKQERIKHGSGEHMRKPGSKGAPTDAALKASQNESADPCWTGYKQIGMKKKNGKPVPNCVPVKEEKKIHIGKHFKNAETSELQSHNPNDPDSRFDGTTAGADTYRKLTPGQVIKRVIKELSVRDTSNKLINIKNQKFRGSDNKIHSAPAAPSGSHYGD